MLQMKGVLETSYNIVCCADHLEELTGVCSQAFASIPSSKGPGSGGQDTKECYGEDQQESAFKGPFPADINCVQRNTSQIQWVLLPTEYAIET